MAQNPVLPVGFYDDEMRVYNEEGVDLSLIFAALDQSLAGKLVT